MKASGPGHERETIINWNDEDDTATIWTASNTVYRRLLKRLGRVHLTEDDERHAVFAFPRKWLILPRVRDVKPASLATRSKLLVNIAKAQAARSKTSLE